MPIRFFFVLIVFLQIAVSGLCIEKDLPLVVQNNGENKSPLIFHMSGDGGLVRFDLKMMNEYRNNALSFISLNTRKYFFTQKTPAVFAQDCIPVIQHYMQEWNKKELILVGFSFGADVAPFLYESLPPGLKDRVKLIVMLTPSKTSEFRITLRDLLGLGKKDEPYNVADQTAKIKSKKILAVFGENEKTIFPDNDPQPNLKVLFIKGGHDFKDSKGILDLITKEINQE